ncbi:MAG TPA: hypothetical protein PK191_06410 [Niabella sp.]|nr:hypothetical protein [Niabella sp.]HOZ95577.1 hypothetical protein [Niabella sp.]HQW13817.1 hypothetical protein [Niabella sp.]HQX19290.1 hypothetical protein [Niabella sp.]HQX41642.1 hypothetical protein [Niabella sp.]
MKNFQIILILLLIGFGSCGLSEREKMLKEKETELNTKQQQLLLREQQLTQRETELNNREHLLDSTQFGKDSSIVQNWNIEGVWQIKMQCVETSCEGSAIGDVKTERWEFANSEKGVVVKAFSGNTLTRIYNGTYTQNGMKVMDNNPQSKTSIEVTLRFLKEGKMDGIREIIQPNCKTTFTLNATRQ